MEMEFPDLISSSLPCFVCFGLFGLLKNDAHGACMGRIPTPTKTHTRATHGACAPQPPATQHTTTTNLYFLIYRPRSPPRALAPTPQKKSARIPRGGECPICDKHYTYNTTTSSLHHQQKIKAHAPHNRGTAERALKRWNHLRGSPTRSQCRFSQSPTNQTSLYLARKPSKMSPRFL